MTTSHFKPLLFIPSILFAAAATVSPWPRPTFADNGELLVVSIGDSLASGERAPDVPKGPSSPAIWLGDDQRPARENNDCHRSKKAGPALAYYERIRLRYPLSSFLNVACSGAGSYNGLIAPQSKDAGTPVMTVSQIQLVREWRQAKGGRRIDALFVAVGGNDIGFEGIVGRCIADISCQNNPHFVDNYVAAPLADLDRRYDELARVIQGARSDKGVHHRVPGRDAQEPDSVLRRRAPG